MVDLVNWGRNKGSQDVGNQVQIFNTVEELRKYTIENRKIFKNTFRKDSDEAGTVLRHLLRKIFVEDERDEEVDFDD